MHLNHNILDQVQLAGAQLVAVTKYLSPAEIKIALPVLQDHPAVFGLGENRVLALESKSIPREHCHFIGNIQSRDIPKIVEYCHVIHSVDSLRHAEKISKYCVENDLLIKFFVQINISGETQKGGIDPDQLPGFLVELEQWQNCEVVGLSGMGSLTVGATKVEEFECLKKLRDKYLPEGLISAGTSSDYEIALACGVDIVRVGRALF